MKRKPQVPLRCSISGREPGGGGGREEKWGEGSQVSCRVPQFSPQHRQVPADPLIALENLTFYRNKETLLFLPCFSL